MKRHEVNMLEGALFPNIIAFAIPIVLTSLLQLLFNAADLAVVGRFAGSQSVAAVGATGSITGLIAVEDDAFATPAYTQVYVRADWLDRYNCFSDEYEAGIEELTGRIEAIAGQQCEIRYLDVTEEAGEQLADARKELEDAKAEADEEFADAWEQILDGKEQIQSGWDEFNASKEEFDQGKAEYESGLKSYYENLVLIEDGERQIACDFRGRKERHERAGCAGSISRGGEAGHCGLRALRGQKSCKWRRRQ
jgi:hypothetical protein